MLHIVCFNSDNYLGRGAEYVNILHDSVTRNLPDGFPGEFVCFTDDPAGLHPHIVTRPLPCPDSYSWYHKLGLMQHGIFPDGDRVIYMDLDTVITGPLDEFVKYDGEFASLRDFFRPVGIGAAILSWRAGGIAGEIFRFWLSHGFPEHIYGDQGIMEDFFRYRKWPEIIQDMYPGDFRSYKVDCQLGIPKGTKVICFHGLPRPHEVTTDWMPQVWKIGGGTSAEMVTEPNIPSSQLTTQIQSAMKRDGTWLHVSQPHGGVAAICAGGPSLSEDLEIIKLSRRKVFAINGSYKYLADHGIDADYHVLLDGRQQNISFVPETTKAEQIYCSQCHPDVLDAAKNLTLYHPFFDGVLDITGENCDSAFIGGGTTAGLKAIAIAYALGYRKIHIYGFDSCYKDKENHAYSQPMNDGERILDVTFEGKTFRCAPWMITQAEDFQSLMGELVPMGAEIYVHGDGLIPAMAGAMGKIEEVAAADVRAREILKRLEGRSNPNVAEIGVFAGDLSKRLLGQRDDLTLTMIDSWSGTPSPEMAETGDFHSTLNQEKQDDYYQITKFATSFAQDRARIIRKSSADAAREIEDNFLDLVFIDADHSYEGCKTDIEVYYDKVKPGGIISGHDYNHQGWKFGPMVKKAVDEFIAQKSLVLELGEDYTWFAVKQENS